MQSVKIFTLDDGLISPRELEIFFTQIIFGIKIFVGSHWERIQFGMSASNE